MKKKIGLTILTVFIIFFGWKLFQKIFQPSDAYSGKGGGGTVAVEISPIQRTIIIDQTIFTGSLLAKTEYTVAPKVFGRIKQLFVDVGDKVKRGDLIAVLEDDEFLQAVEQARAELDVAKANLEESTSSLEITNREYERAKSLRAKELISETDYETIEAKYLTQVAKNKVNAAQVAQKEAQFRAAQIRHSYTQIAATWEGNSSFRVVGERFADEGTMLNTNAPIVTILDITSLTGEIYVIEQDYLRLKLNQKVNILVDAFPDKIFTGKIARIAPRLDENSRQAKVEIEIDNSDNLLKPGMFARFIVEFNQHENVVVIPLPSIVKRNDTEGIFLANVEEKKANFVQIKTGIINQGFIEVIEPDLSGYLVTTGQNLLDDGMNIFIQEENIKKRDN